MMRKSTPGLGAVCFSLCLVFLFQFSLNAASRIKITADPPFPANNLLTDPGFEEGDEKWKAFSGSSDRSKTYTVDKDRIGPSDRYKRSGKYSYKIIGNRETNNYVKQRVHLSKPIPAGTEITISAWSKSAGTLCDGGNYGISMHAVFTDRSASYLPAPRFPRTSRDWMEVTTTVVPKKDVASFTLYICYYDQEGEAYFDDISVTTGKTMLSYAVDSDSSDIKRVRLFSEKKGLIKDSGELARGARTHSDSKEVSISDRYYVEAEDRAGVRFGARYPEKNESPLPKTGDGEINVFTRFSQDIINSGNQETYPVTLPKIDVGKEVFLQLKARSTFSKVAGLSFVLQILVNGREVTFENIVDRPARFTFADGRKLLSVRGGNIFSLYLAPDFSPISNESSYFPVDLPANNPYTFKFRITDLVKEGANTITIKHANPRSPQPMVVGDAKLVIK